MKQFILLLVLAFTPVIIFAQNISVKSFLQLPNDLDARVTFPKPDQNGDKCAIIKIVTSESDFTWDGDMLGIVAIEKKTGEYWLYVPHEAKRLTIKHSKIGILRDYEYPEPILEATVYEILLETARIEDEPKEIVNQLLSIMAEPKGASIFLNDNYESTDSLKRSLIPGIYKYMVMAQYYHTDSGKVLVPNDRGENLKISLKPSHGFVNLSSVPKPGAQVIIDGALTNLMTPCTTGILISGDHTFTLLKSRFRPLTQNITVRDGLTEEAALTMQSNRNYIKEFYRKHFISLSAGYYNTTFSNSVFKAKIKDGSIRKGLGYAATLNVNFFPAIIDLTYFSSAFSVKNTEPFTSNSIITHRGGEFCLDFIPFVFGVNGYVYFGGGYQYSQLYAASLSINGIASTNTSLPIAKGGMKLMIKKFQIFGEYKNGFDINGSGYASGQIYGGVGWTF